MVLECPTCDDCFYDRYDWHEHMNDYDHWLECETCDREFGTVNSRNQHMNQQDHWAPRYECHTCSNVYSSINARDQHMDAKRHRSNTCYPCNGRVFADQNAYNMHMNSRTHRGANVPCPFCKTGFTSASGLMHHLERSSCPNAPQLNHQSILNLVRKKDPNGFIANKQLTWHDNNTTTYEATNDAWDGQAWNCGLCPREFATLNALKAHYRSPVHQANVYHCPKRGCNKEFKALAALFNHLESESCNFIRYDQVQKQVVNVFSGRMIQF